MTKNHQEVNNFVGIDIGKRQLELIRATSNGRYHRFQTKTTREGENQLLKWLKSEDVVLMEAGNQSFRIAKRIEREKGNEVIVLNPGDVAMIYRSLKKTDKEDSLKLAKLGQRNPREELPEVNIPTDEEENARRLSTEQIYWSKQLTKGKNRLHSLFTQAGLTEIMKQDLKTRKNREAVIVLLPERYEKEAKRILGYLNMVEENLNEIDEDIKEKLQENINYSKIAMSFPGVGPVTTLALLAYVGDCSRFSSGKQVSYYTGLVPRVDQSGDTTIYGKITKRGCTPIRRTIVQGAWALVRSDHGGELKEFYDKLSKRIGKKKAIVAVARKMMETFYSMICNDTLYRGIPESIVLKKLNFYGLTL